jgi:hypothetical protein
MLEMERMGPLLKYVLVSKSYLRMPAIRRETPLPLDAVADLIPVKAPTKPIVQ